MSASQVISSPPTSPNPFPKEHVVMPFPGRFGKGCEITRSGHPCKSFGVSLRSLPIFRHPCPHEWAWLWPGVLVPSDLLTQLLVISPQQVGLQSAVHVLHVEHSEEGCPHPALHPLGKQVHRRWVFLKQLRTTCLLHTELSYTHRWIQAKGEDDQHPKQINAQKVPHGLVWSSGFKGEKQGEFPALQPRPLHLGQPVPHTHWCLGEWALCTSQKEG